MYTDWKSIEKNTQRIYKAKGLTVKMKDGKAQIACSRDAEFYRGLGVVRQWKLEEKTEGFWEETPCVDHLTYMVDCSRNAVCNISYLKKLIQWMAYMGYDRLMLYTEDTYEIEGRPFFGWMRGRFKKDEIRELDEFSHNYGIELVPCIQTLAHLNAIFRWKAFQPLNDTSDILNTGMEETYELIEDMIRFFAENVHSRVINLGMDEAEMIGRGKFLNQFGYEERFTIMQRHLNRVLQICEKYGFKCMMWSDMFFKLLSKDSYYSESVDITDEVKAMIPQNVELIYWDYYSRKPEIYDRMLTNHKALTPHVCFAGGAWKWTGFAPLMEHSRRISRMALKACRKHEIRNVIVTGWGDNGGEAAQSSVLSVLSLYAEGCYSGNMEDEWISKRLEACTDADYGDFKKLDLPNLTPDNPVPGRVSAAPSKYLLYQDILLGIYDKHVDPGTYPEHYRKSAMKLHTVAEKGGEFGYIFETLAALCDVLEYKCDLGIRIKNAYQKKDRKELITLAERIKETENRVEVFRQKLKKQWFYENKAFGFEIQDIRLSGLKGRLISAVERIMEFVNGETDILEELEEDRLILEEKKDSAYTTFPVEDNNWGQIVSASVI